MRPQQERVISPVTLAAALVVIALLAATPFVIASVISDWRITAAADTVAALARTVNPSSLRGNADVLIGTGTLPRIDGAAGWPTERFAELRGGPADGGEVNPAPADPWRNAYLVNIGARGAVWVVSAGPNGVLDTPFEGDAIAGDDIGARLR